MTQSVADGSGYGAGGTLDVAKFLGALPFTRFHFQLLMICSVVTFFDGLDFALIAYTLPYIREQMQLGADEMGLISAAAVLGQMIGSLGGSYVADLIGRRPVILICTVLSAILTFATGLANSPDMLVALRFVSGMAIGGLLAPAWAINLEAMPPGRRATAVTIIMLGFSLGGAMAAPLTNFLAPAYGWEMVFYICGIMTLLLAVVLQFTLPESARWLVATGAPREKVEPLLRRFDPSFQPAAYTGYALSDERKTAGKRSPQAKFMELFHGALLFITPLIWVAYFCSSVAMYFKASYGVQYLEMLGLERTDAAWLGSIGGLTGAVAGVLLLRFTEKLGPAWIALAPLLAAPAALAIGMGLTSGPLFIPVVLFGSIMLGAGHAAIISMTAIYYPSAIRSTGGGWASFMAKIGSTLASFFGAYFLVSQAAVLEGYIVSAIVLVGFGICALALAPFARRLKAEESAAAAVPPAAAPLPAGASA
jgi:AAHS family 4-hydroxybenzoate transporter-like MFS transporter